MFGTLSGTALVEVVLVAIVVVLAVLLVVSRVRRAGAARRRRAAGSFYFDHDAAHYGPAARSATAGAVDPVEWNGPSPQPRHNATQPMAPSFNAPRAHKSRSTPTAPTAQSPPRVTPAPCSGMNHPSEVTPATAPTSSGRPSLMPPPTMAEPPVAEPVGSDALAPLPALRPKGTLPANLPAMPAPPPSDAPD